jgi:hypothetical protein
MRRCLRRSLISTLISFCAVSLLVLTLCPPCRSQSSDATLGGVIEDRSGAVIPNVKVKVIDVATGITRDVTTNGDGIFSVPGLNPGKYSVHVEHPGFADVEVTDITLNVASNRQLEIKLAVGKSQQSVTVDGSGLTLNTTDASVSTVIDRKFVENTPLNGRSFQDLISMTPGVVTQSPQTSEQVPGVLGDFSVNGQRTESNYYTVDGVTANISSGNGGAVGGASTGGTLGGSTALGTTQTLISVDALQEFRVESSTYSAEYGHSPGGQFALVTRSGTNAFQGTVFDYLRNNFFDANNWFNDHYGDPQPALRQNDFGGTLGGPVRIPKLYNGKGRTFFFVSYEGLRVDQPTAATIQYVPDLFMRQQATAAMQPILNAFPLPNGIDYGSAANPSLAQFIEPFSLPSAIDSTSLRVDHIISPKLSLFFRFGDTPSSSISRPEFARDTTISNATTYTLGVTSQLSHRLTDEFRLGYARSNSSIIGALDNFGGATPIDLAAAMGAGAYQKVEPVILFDISGIGEPGMLQSDSSNAGRQWNLVDTISLLEGHHTLKFGVDYRHIKSPISPATEQPYAIFGTTQQILAGTPEAPYVFSYVPSTPIFDQTALFAQDEWRVHSRLSLSLGLRWEVNPPPTEQHGNDAYTLLGNLNDPSTVSVAPRGTPLWNTTWYNFAPRLGMAWAAHDHPGRETVVRAGGGVFFDSANEVAALGYANSLGFEAYQLLNGARIPFTPSQLDVPITVTPPYTSAVITAFPEHLQLPYTLEWNTSLQQAVGESQSLTISYVASNGRRLLAEQTLSLASLNPNFGTVQYFPNGITSNYQALQAQFQRTVARGIQALASYTWSHSIDFGSSAYELPLQRGNSDFDVRNNLQGGISWTLPTIDSTQFTNILLNGWGLDARLNVRSAFPVMPEGNEFVDPATGGISNGELNLVAGQPTYVYGNQYPGGKAINPAAFSLPATGISGDAPRNFVRGFGATQLNMAARREFHLHDALVLQFRAEAFNILNHPNFGNVDPLYTDATFGQATETLNSSLGTVASQYQQGGPRSMQFALRLSF